MTAGPSAPTRTGAAPSGSSRQPGGPSRPGGASSVPDRSGTWRVLGWLVVALVVVGILVVASPDGDRPYAIDSAAPGGTDILRRVLVSLDVEVVEGNAGDLVRGLEPDDVVVVFQDRLTDAQDEQVRAHVEAGGTVVVGDAGSSLAGTRSLVRGVGVAGPPRCDLLPSRAVVALDVDAFAGRGATAVPTLVDTDSGDGGTPTAACWRDGDTALVARWDRALGPGTPSGPVDGATIVLGDADVVTNARIMEDPDLAQLTALFLPPDGSDGRVVVLVGPEVAPVPGSQAGGSADGSIEGALPARFRSGLWVAALAAVLYALSRARRHGHVLVELPPVEVPASALAGSIAELLERHGQAADAAARVRAELRADLGPRLGTSGRDADALASLAVRASGLDHQTVALAVGEGPVDGAADLVAVVASGRRLRAALAPATDPTPGSPTAAPAPYPARDPTAAPTTDTVTTPDRA